MLPEPRPSARVDGDSATSSVPRPLATPPFPVARDPAVYVCRAWPTGGRGRESPVLLGSGSVELGEDLPVVFQRQHLRRVAVDGGPLAGVIGGHDRTRGRRPDASFEQARDSPGEHARDVLVAAVLVAEPRGVGHRLAHEHRGLVRHVVVRVREPERREAPSSARARGSSHRAGRRSRPARRGGHPGCTCARRSRDGAGSRRRSRARTRLPRGAPP